MDMEAIICIRLKVPFNAKAGKDYSNIEQNLADALRNRNREDILKAREEFAEAESKFLQNRIDAAKHAEKVLVGKVCKNLEQYGKIVEALVEEVRETQS